MKHFISVLSFLFISIQIVIAQHAPRRDTAWGNFRNQVYYNSILKAPVVTGETQPINIIPNRGPFCFDKKVIIKAAAGSKVFEQCMYIDTKGGLVAYLSPVTTARAEMCDIKTEEEEFLFYIIGLKGNVYIYRNTKKNGAIEHWVSTGNTQNYQYQTNGSTGVYTLQNKHVRKGFCNEKIKATAYKYNDPASPTLYLFGKNYPEAINVTSNKYIGSFGVGYQFTDKGLYIIMETTSDSYECKINSIEDVNVCFDPSQFKIQEDEFVTKRRAELQKERAKLDRDEGSIRNDDACAGARRNILVFRRAQLRLQEEGLEAMQQGNLYQDPAAQRASLNMMDPLFMVQGNILDIQLSICNTAESIRRNPSSSLTTKLSCLQGFLSRLHVAESEMSALDVQYADTPAKAMGEKSKVYLRIMGTGCN